MRLINVDNFLKRFSYQVPGDTIDAINLRLALLNEPKVDAIPIEWLEQMWERDKDGFTDEYGEYHNSEGSLGESCQHVLENWRTNYRWKWEAENDSDDK